MSPLPIPWRLYYIMALEVSKERFMLCRDNFEQDIPRHKRDGITAMIPKLRIDCCVAVANLETGSLIRHSSLPRVQNMYANTYLYPVFAYLIP